MNPLKALLDDGYRYAVFLTGDGVAADDLLQDAWTTLLAANGRRDKPYLYRTIRSRWIDGHRRRQVLDVVPGLDADRLGGRPEQAWGLEHADLWREVQALRPEEREALFLCAVEGHTAQEVADRSGQPRNTVLSLVHRARKKLRERLESLLEAG